MQWSSGQLWQLCGLGISLETRKVSERVQWKAFLMWILCSPWEMDHNGKLEKVQSSNQSAQQDHRLGRLFSTDAIVQYGRRDSIRISITQLFKLPTVQELPSAQKTIVCTIVCETEVVRKLSFRSSSGERLKVQSCKVKRSWMEKVIFWWLTILFSSAPKCSKCTQIDWTSHM